MHFFVCLLISYVVGVVWNAGLIESNWVAVWLLLLALALGMVGQKRKTSTVLPLTVSLCLFGLALGLIRTELFLQQFEQSDLSRLVNEDVQLEGLVITEPDYREQSVQVHLDTGTDKILVSADRNIRLSYGDVISVTGRLEQPTTFQTELGRTFDYPKYLEVRGIKYRISFAQVEVLENEKGNPIIAALLNIKQVFVNSIEQVIPEPEVGLGSGLLLGIKSALGDEIETNFRRTGIIHIVVLSGYNVMLVVAFIMFCFSFFLSLKGRMVAGVLAIIAFALIVGLSATVVRASIMACLVLIATAYGKQYDVTRALFLAGFIMLIINPYLVYDIGFQLSFMATLGLLLILPRFETNLLEGKYVVKMKEFFLATLATQIAVLPLLMYHIGEVSLIALAVNVFVLPMVPVAMLLTFLTGGLWFLSTSLAAVCGLLATWSLTYILKIAEWFSILPFATVTVPEFGWFGVLIMYIVMGVTLIYLKTKQQTDANEFTDWTIEEENKITDELCSSDIKDLPKVFR